MSTEQGCSRVTQGSPDLRMCAMCCVQGEQRKICGPTAMHGGVTNLTLNAGSPYHSLTCFLRQEKCETRRTVLQVLLGLHSAGELGQQNCPRIKVHRLEFSSGLLSHQNHLIPCNKNCMQSMSKSQRVYYSPLSGLMLFFFPLIAKQAGVAFQFQNKTIQLQ